ncbi:MAG: glycosyltransferase family 2 protein [Pseudomonadota bacterium]
MNTSIPAQEPQPAPNAIRGEGGARTKNGAPRASRPGKPLLTIITVVYNGAATLAHTIATISEQGYDNVEYIIVDGGSTDATLAIIREHEDKIDYWVSAKDKGIYDAMNKGIALARGEIIGFLNADDFYAEPDVLEQVCATFDAAAVDACYGDLCYVKQDNTKHVVRYWRSSAFVPGLFQSGWCPPHPTFFARKRLYDQFGGFDLDYRIAGDMELMARLLVAHKVHSVYLPRVLVNMRMGGESNKSVGNVIKQNREIWKAFGKHGMQPSLAGFIGGKLFARCKQFLLRPS